MMMMEQQTMVLNAARNFWTNVKWWMLGLVDANPNLDTTKHAILELELLVSAAPVKTKALGILPHNQSVSEEGANK